jgi:hypothetical protein
MRNYENLLNPASEYLTYSGYLDQKGRSERKAAKARFDQARRVFVYEQLKAVPEAKLLRPIISAEIDRLERENGTGMGEYQLLREELLPHIDKQAGAGSLLRFATRWVVPGLGFGGFVLYVAFKIWTIEHS